ncbi:MAG: hypothetical protein BWY76_02908 [bacterium ADurb.Bin429]|nr:MAG: hypothetical protein BWY76_02908 [bacterium ADurb.Bin429]
MVNSLGNILRLAGQRVLNKPYTVSEYNHPYPNQYGAEGQATLAVYGRLQGWDGIFLDATDAANVGTPVRFYGRAVLMLTGQALLILDRARIKHTGLGEVRFHTRAAARFYTASARLTRNDASLHLAFAANVPCRLTESRGMPTTVTRDADTILRWGTVGKHTDLIFATLLTPNGTGRVKLNADTRTITARGPGFAVSLRYSEEGLELE